ncbi:MAG: hypothetical protein JNM18_01845 [Planctomycetaceae bacterium]|nr:hypothetical protein [Planctomycetaceae bacterium]
MARLLVSVRDATEAAVALAAGVDLLDLKEPRAGALGAVSADIVREVAGLIDARTPLSVACGELLDGAANGPNLFSSETLSGVSYAKVGLAGCASRADWPELWRQFASALPHGTQPVAVAYVDAAHAAAPPIESVLEITAPLGARALLLDTWGKSHGGLLNHVTLPYLAEILSTTKRRGMLTVLGGSLDLATIEKLLPLVPDVIAVRGAACADRREGNVDRVKICGLVELLRRHNSPELHDPKSKF